MLFVACVNGVGDRVQGVAGGEADSGVGCMVRLDGELCIFA